MDIIKLAYHLLSAGLLVLLGWNFVREKKSRDDLVLILLVMIPFVLRLLRVK